MFERITYLLSALLLLTGCLDDSYRGTPDNLYGYGSQEIPVVVALGDPTGGIAKGSGPIDKVEEWAGKHIYVYAFNKNVPNSFSSYSYARRDKCLVDGSVENQNSKAGKKARLAADDSYAKWDTEEPDMIYPAGKNQKAAFDFFAYYLDDLEPPYTAYTRTDNSISVDIEIDGRQDIMSSKAELTDAQLRPFTEKDKVSVIENAFSFYTAQRNIAPTFMFKHHLVNLEFELVSDLVSEEPKTVTVHAMSVESQTKATFVVADRDGARLGLTFRGGVRELPLKQKDGTDMPDDKYVIHSTSWDPEGAEDYDRETIRMDESLLVAPAQAYDLYMVMTEKYDNGKVVIERQKSLIDITYPKGFVAGNKYKVKLVIKGAINVLAYVDVEPWGTGGKLDVDTESDKPDIE